MPRLRLPTGRSIAAVGQSALGRWALASNTTEAEMAEPGSELLFQAPGSAFELRSYWPNLALRALRVFEDGTLIACGMGGKALHFDGQGFVETALPHSDAVHSLWGPGLDDVVAVGDGVVSRFDGTRWHSMAVPQVHENTYVSVDGHQGVRWFAVNRTEGPFVVRGEPPDASLWELPSFAVYQVHACDSESAVALASDGLWALKRGEPPSRLWDLRKAEAKPFGNPACMAVWRGQVAFASIDGVSVMKALLMEKESLHSSAVNVWWNGKHVRLPMGDAAEISHVSMVDGVLTVGLRGELWEEPLEMIFPH